MIFGGGRSPQPKKKILDTFFLQKRSNVFEQTIFFSNFFSDVKIYMKHAESAEWKEKSNFRFFPFLFFK